MSPFLRTRAELEENLYRQDMTWQEQAEGSKKLHDLFKTEFGKDWTQEQTAAILGSNQSSLARDLKVAEALEKDPELRKANSRKAAVRAIDMKVSHTARLARSSLAVSHATTVRSKLFLGDARDYARQMKLGSIDLIFTDPPYGIDYYDKPDGSGAITKKNQGGLSKYDDSAETTRDLLVDLVPQWFRMTHDASWIAVMMNEANYGFLRDLMENCCATHFDYRALPDETTGDGPLNYCETRSLDDRDGDEAECKFLKAEEPHWIWYRPNSHLPSMYPDRHAQNAYERILVLNRGNARLSYPCQNVINIDNEYGNERWHAMQKPLELCLEVIKRLSLPGERVFDSTFGSGNLLKAASMCSRDFRGSEMNPSLHELAIASISADFGGEVVRLEPDVRANTFTVDEVEPGISDGSDLTEEDMLELELESDSEELAS
jgi:DNA modification methylase